MTTPATNGRYQYHVAYAGVAARFTSTVFGSLRITLDQPWSNGETTEAVQGYIRTEQDLDGVAVLSFQRYDQAA